MRGIERLRRAKDELVGRPAGSPDRLRAAAREFGEAAEESDGWPLRFRIKAGLLRARLGDGDGIERTVSGMGEAELQAAADDLRLFCDEAERAVRGFAEV